MRVDRMTVLVLACLALAGSVSAESAQDAALTVLLENPDLDAQREAYDQLLAAPEATVEAIRKRLEQLAGQPAPLDEVVLNKLLYLAAYLRRPEFVPSLESLLARFETLPDQCIYTCPLLFTLALYAIDGLWQPPTELEGTETEPTWLYDLTHEIKTARTIDLRPKNPRTVVISPRTDERFDELELLAFEEILEKAGPCTSDWDTRFLAACVLECTVIGEEYIEDLYWLALQDVYDDAAHEYRLAVYLAIYRAERARRIRSSGWFDESAVIQNSSFAAGLDAWQTPAAPVLAEVVEDAGGYAARVTVPEEAPVGWPGLSQWFEVAPGDLLAAETDARAENISNGYGAYFAVEFMSARDQRISYVQTQAAGPDWTRLDVKALTPPDTAYAMVKLIVNGHGTGWFRNVSVEKTGVYTTDAPDGPVTLTVTKDVVCDSLIGFGAEDDGWFYNDENKNHGVDDKAIRLREDRVARMDIDWVRMFFWYPDWNPSGDWETFTFDSVNMQSHCRTLDLYQKVGAKVTVVGVEWGMQDPFGQPEALAMAWGALLDYLVHERGYTCIKYWTLTNEPNSFFVQRGNPFERYVELHRLMAAELERRGLDVGIAGSDDTAGLAWFQQCAADTTYRDVADVFVSHRYFHFADRIFASDFYDDRFKSLAQNGIGKPFAVAEFGFQDARSGALENPLMEDYDYALWTAEFIIEGLNRGVAGYTIWCLQEMYYPGNGFMNYGLWNFGGDWKVRPVYFAMLQFTQKTEPGMKVYRCTSTHESVVKGACVGKTLFWVNNSDEAVDVIVEGLATIEAHVFEESTLRGEVDCSVAQPIRNVPVSNDSNGPSPTQRVFTAPPKSFGYCGWPVRPIARR